MLYGNSLGRNQVKWLAKRFGYSFGWRGNMKWDQPSIEYLIINKWGSIFEVSQYITNIVVFKGNVQIDGTSELIHAMLLRTIIRPCMGLERAIEDKPLDPQYNFLVELPYPF